MNKDLEIVRLQLRPGDTPARVMAVLGQLVGKEVYCELSSKFILITEINFLKKIKLLFGADLEKLHFVTQKPFFVDLLNKRNFNVLDIIPNEHKDVSVQQIRDFMDRIEAKKNKSAAPEEVAAEPVAESNKVVETAKVTNKLKTQFTKRKIENLARGKSWRGVVFFLLLALIGSLMGLFFFIAPRAEIVVKPRIDTIQITQNTIVTLPNAEIPKSEERLPVVPAIMVQTEVAGSETFATTRAEYEVTNARGKVTLYNEDSVAKFLVPSRLMTDEGLIFRTQEEVLIPAAKDEIPGAIVVEIIADSYDEEERPIGDRGNIEEGVHLDFPALRPELKKLYYAKSDQGPLVGGSILTRYILSDSDESLAREVFAESFKVRGMTQIEKEIAGRNQREDSRYVLLDQESLIRAELIDYSFPIDDLGKELSTFNASARYEISALVFDQGVAIDQLREKLQQNQDERKKIIEIDEGAIEYRFISTGQLVENGWAKVSISITGVETLDFEANNLYAQDWQDAIKREVIGKDMTQARGILINHPEVEEVLSLKITPFWNKYVPSILDQIDLQISS